jgi:GNAT superfamily N-acetyltransferase
LRPSDQHLLEVILDGLGAESRLQRFLAPRPVLTARDLSIIASVDGIVHVGVIALAVSPATPIGAAHYVRSEDPETAETAIEVVDTCQRRGIGRLLIAELRAHAAQVGIRRFTWSAFASNHAVAALTRDLNDCRHTHVGGGVIEWSASI